MEIVSKQRLILGTDQADDIRSGPGKSVIFAGSGDDSVRAGGRGGEWQKGRP